jgi:hypothetical protein
MDGMAAGVKTKPFARFAGREGIADEELCEAVSQAERGLIDADLGGGVIKQRLAREGQGNPEVFGASYSFVAARRRFSSTVSLRATGTTSGGTN